MVALVTWLYNDTKNVGVNASVTLLFDAPGGDGDHHPGGGDNPDEFHGQDGNDTLFGGMGFFTDILVGGDGDDLVVVVGVTGLSSANFLFS